jgi:phage repressor protein C with HTH and peptisase S24 domain
MDCVFQNEIRQALSPSGRTPTTAPTDLEEKPRVDVDLVLRRLAEAMGVTSQEELAAVLGKDLQTLRVWRTRKRVPPSTIAHVAKSSGKPVAWLEGAESEPPRVEEPTPSFFAPRKKHVNRQGELADFFFVPEVDVRAGAGGGQLVDSEEVIGKFAFRRSWLRQKGVRPESLAVVTARGDSMAPTVNDRDILLVDTAVERLTSDGIYLIEQSNNLQCKRLQFELGNGIIVKSDNPAYHDQRLSFDEAAGLRIAGRVIWVGGER